MRKCKDYRQMVAMIHPLAPAAGLAPVCCRAQLLPCTAMTCMPCATSYCKAIRAMVTLSMAWIQQASAVVPHVVRTQGCGTGKLLDVTQQQAVSSNAGRTPGWPILLRSRLLLLPSHDTAKGPAMPQPVHDDLRTPCCLPVISTCTHCTGAGGEKGAGCKGESNRPGQGAQRCMLANSLHSGPLPCRHQQGGNPNQGIINCRRRVVRNTCCWSWHSS